MKLFKFTKGLTAAINETDGRVSKVIAAVAPTAEEIAAASRLNEQRAVARNYLQSRDKCALTSQTFKYVPANHTDIKGTMRNFILETMPAAKQEYGFLFTQ